jgi:TPR repeat protein
VRRRVLLSLLAAGGLVVIVAGAVALVEGFDRRASGPDLSELAARAKSGEAQAQLELGTAYAAGSKEVPAKPAEGYRWIQKAAEQGLPEAQEAVGRMLLFGIGVPADPRAAMGWYEKAALQGRAEAQGRLAGFYHEGISVPQDFARALDWYRKAAAQGDGESMYNLGIIYAEGQGQARDFLVAGQWFNKAAEHGYGFGVPDRYQEAVRWAEQVEKYRPAADNGDPEAQYRLAALLYGPQARARNVPHDSERAIKLYRTAAAKGHAQAMYALGVIYQGKIADDGFIFTDYVKAHMWYNLAASRLPAGRERDQAARDRDFLARYRLTPEELAEAQRLAREWEPEPSM